MKPIRFEARDLNPWADPVTVDILKEGEVYFSVQFADDDMLIPIMETWVFAGKKLDPEDVENRLYFQDVESYLHGVRYDSANHEEAEFQVPTEKNINHIFDFERALEVLMRCSLARKKAGR
jgi:hypothetical protein